METPIIYDYQIYDDMIYIFGNETDEKFRMSGKFDLICGGSELSEETLIPFLDYFVHEDDAIVENQTFNANVYKDYRDNGYLDDALDSFISAIEANQMFWNNPLQSTKPTDDLTFYDSKEEREITIKKWQEAESCTFNPKQCLIFEIL